jgi:LruC domain-containing protein
MSVTYTFVDLFDSAGYPLRMNKDKQDPLISNKRSLSDAFMTDVIEKLPEGRRLPDSHPTWMMPCDIHLVENCTVLFTYVVEGAGYKNALGYHVYDTASPPTSASQITDRRILIPNFSGANEKIKYYGTTGGGSLSSGDSLDVPFEVDTVNQQHNYSFPAGKSIGFFIISNGWSNGSWNSGNTQPNPSTVLRLSNDIMFSNPALNTANPTGQKEQFACLQSKIDPDVIIYGVEDIRRPGGDKDFNDAVFLIEATPSTAIAPGSYVPNNTAKAASWGTVMIEDDVYDNDYNDAIFNYNVVENLTKTGLISQIVYDVELLARGSWHDHCIGFCLPGIGNLRGKAKRQIRTTDLTRYRNGEDDAHTAVYGPVTDITSQVFTPSNTEGRVVAIPCTKQFTMGPGVINGGDGFSWNTGPLWQKSPQKSVGFRVMITFNTPVTRAALGGSITPYVIFADIFDTNDFTSLSGITPVTRTYRSDTEYPDQSYYWRYQKLDLVPKILITPLYACKMPQAKQPVWVTYPFLVPFLKSGKHMNPNWYKFPYQCYNPEIPVPRETYAIDISADGENVPEEEKNHDE